MSMVRVYSFLAFFLVGILAGTAGVGAALERITLKLEGLTPSGCSSPAVVRGTMKSMEGVVEAEVSLERGEAVVEFDPGKADLAELAVKVERFCRVKVIKPPSP